MFADSVIKNKKFTVCVEGNIGCGKTTFLEYFKDENNMSILVEPVNKWRNLNGVNLLESMYNDAKKWALPLQSYITLTMLENHMMSTPGDIKLMERSIHSARHCFVENMHKTGLLDDVFYSILDEWYKFAEKSLPVQPDLIIYLRTSPEVAYQRIKQRGRPEEMSIPFEYIRQLNQLHETWLDNCQNNGILVFIINADANLDTLADEYRLCKCKIERLAYRS